MNKTMLMQLLSESFRITRFSTIPGVILMILCSAGLSPLIAAEPFKVGIISPNAVIENSIAGKQAIATLQEHTNAKKKLLDADQKAIQDLEAILQKANSLTEEERADKQDYYTKTYQEYQQKVQEFQKRGQEFEQELAKKRQEMVVDYMNKIQAVTKAVAEKLGFSMVVDKGNSASMQFVLYNEEELDITNEVVKEFDKRYK